MNWPQYVFRCGFLWRSTVQQHGHMNATHNVCEISPCGSAIDAFQCMFALKKHPLCAMGLMSRKMCVGLQPDSVEFLTFKLLIHMCTVCIWVLDSLLHLWLLLGLQSCENSYGGIWPLKAPLQLATWWYTIKCIKTWTWMCEPNSLGQVGSRVSQIWSKLSP